MVKSARTSNFFLGYLRSRTIRSKILKDRKLTSEKTETEAAENVLNDNVDEGIIGDHLNKTSTNFKTFHNSLPNLAYGSADGVAVIPIIFGDYSSGLSGSM